MTKIDPQSIKNRYNTVSNIWDASDKWHSRVFKLINNFLSKVEKLIQLNADAVILNAGSAGNGYCFQQYKNHIHIDIAYRTLKENVLSIVANIELLPIRHNKSDLVVCVGSVLNYCDPMKVIEEFSKTLKTEGYIILEFENSRTLELIGKRNYNAAATIIETFYKGEKETIWYFSEDYIVNILKLYGFSIELVLRYHIISPLIYRLTGLPNFSSYFAYLDPLFTYVPIMRTLSSNVLLLAKKSILN